MNPIVLGDRTTYLSQLSRYFRDIWMYLPFVWCFTRYSFKVHTRNNAFGVFWFFLKPLVASVFLIFIQLILKQEQLKFNFSFYFLAMSIWAYFETTVILVSICFSSMSAKMVSKVYIPKVSVYIGLVLIGFIIFCVQLLFFIAFFFVEKFLRGEPFVVHGYASFLHIISLVLLLFFFSFIVSSIVNIMSVKYRDVSLSLEFLLRLLFFATPILYTLSSVPVKYMDILSWNPICTVLEGFRYFFLGNAYFNISLMYMMLGMSVCIAFIVVCIVCYRERNIVDVL